MLEKAWLVFEWEVAILLGTGMVCVISGTLGLLVGRFLYKKSKHDGYEENIQG